MANPLDIVYSRKNADGTAFNEKTLVPVPKHYVVCDDCGDLTTFTSSFEAALTTGSTHPITASWSISSSWAPIGSSSYSLYSEFSESSSYAPVEPEFSSSISIIKQNSLVTGGTYAITSSWASSSLFAISASYAGIFYPPKPDN